LVIDEVDRRLRGGGKVLMKVPQALTLPPWRIRNFFLEPFGICLSLIAAISR
jgi:hypothetical protein